MLTTEEVLRTDQGFLRYYDFTVREQKSRHDEKLLALEGEDMIYVSPNTDSPHRSVDLTRVKTHRGPSLQVVAGTGLLTVNDRLDWTTTPAGRRSPGRDLVVARLTRPMATSGPLLKTFAVPDDAPGAAYPNTYDMTLGFDLGWMCGLCVSDGWVDPGEHSCDVYLTSTTEPVLHAVRRIASQYSVGSVQLARVKPRLAFGSGVAHTPSYRFSSRRLARLFREALGYALGVRRLPRFWRRTPEPFRRGLLSGLLDGRTGSVYEPDRRQEEVARKEGWNGHAPAVRVQLTFGAANRALARSVLQLGYSLGLTGRLGTHESPAGGPLHRVSFFEDSVGALQRKLDVRHPEKAARLAHCGLGAGAGPERYAPPLPKERLEELRRALKACIVEEGGPSERARDQLLQDVNEALEGADANGERSRPSLLREGAARRMWGQLPGFFDEGYWRRWMDLVLDERFVWEVVETIEPARSEAATSTGHVVEVFFPDAVQPMAVFTASGFGVAPRR